MTSYTRRGFLRVTAQGTAALALVGVTGTLLGGCDPKALRDPDANGLRLPAGFKSRVIATTGEVVAGTTHTWHTAPDGGACFPLADGGWSYVSNCEWFPGGASYVRFASDGSIVGAGSCLTGSIINCAGGATPWGTWLSCEEWPRGQVWECDPVGTTLGVARPAMGRFPHEAAAADATNKCIYLTEDRTDGGLYRFVPTTWGDLSAGSLQVLTLSASSDVLTWQVVPDPSAAVTPTKDQVPDTVRFNGGEGADLSKGTLIFTTKGDSRVWRYDPVGNSLAIIYDRAVQVNGVLGGVDNVEVSPAGVIFVAEDGNTNGADMQIVLVRDDGSTYPVVQVTGTTASEITGPAFDPSGTRLYFSSQREPGRTYEVRGNWSKFT